MTQSSINFDKYDIGLDSPEAQFFKNDRSTNLYVGPELTDVLKALQHEIQESHSVLLLVNRNPGLN